MRRRGFTDKRIGGQSILWLLLFSSTLLAADPEAAKAKVSSAVLADQKQVGGPPDLSNLKKLVLNRTHSEAVPVIEAMVRWWGTYCEAAAKDGTLNQKPLGEVLFLVSFYSWLIDLPELSSSDRAGLSAAVHGETGEDVFVPVDLLLRLDTLLPVAETPSGNETVLSVLRPIALKSVGHVAATAVALVAKRLQFRERVAFISGVLQTGGVGGDGARVGALEVLNSGRRLPDQREAWLGLARNVLQMPGLEQSSLVSSELRSILTRSLSSSDSCASDLSRSED